MVIKKPFLQLKFKDFKLRIFISFLKSSFVWHKDLNNRIVLKVYGNYSIQFENQLPKQLKKINRIKKNKYHRIIPKSLLLIVLIKEK